MLVQVFQEDFLLPYQRFSEAIQQHLSQTPTDLFKVALWIACGYLERELFEDYLLTDERSYFITHDEEIETLPLQKRVVLAVTYVYSSKVSSNETSRKNYNGVN